MTNPIDAKREFRQQNRRPDWSKGTHQTTKAVAKTAGAVTMGIGAVAIGAAVPFSLPVWAPLAATGPWLSALGEAWSDVAWAIHDAHDKDVERPKGHNTMVEHDLLDRSQILSIVDQKPLAAVAGNRAGTRGSITVKDLLPAILKHYKAAHGIMNGRLRDIPTDQVWSCHQLEHLYKNLANLDYHLSKMKAYADALVHFATAFKSFCDHNAANLKQAWDATEKKVDKVMDESEDWHRLHCPVLHTCYRTSKLSRVGTKFN
ncbi:MAG: hypothetical protein K8J09_03910 [Planctomycetes bacterium]|nr:hypothetical protein [Planctomycetota bacterium]